MKQILRDNVAAEARAPSSVPKPALYKSQKKRDFILLIVIPNLLLALLVFFLRKSPIAVVLGTSFMALYTVILIWVMWIVMDTE